MSAETLRTILLIALALSTFACAVFFFRSAPRLLMVAWAVVLFFVPIWIGQQAGIFFSAITVITLMLIFVSSAHRTRFSIIDMALLAFTLLITIACALGWVTWGHYLIAMMGWMVPYLGGRLISSRVSVSWISSTIAVCATVAAGLAIVESITKVNVFVGLYMSNGLYTTWAPLQYRGGQMRVEGAFGHSIALGAALAMSSVFVLVAAWPLWLRLVSLGLISVAAGLTFSRIGMIGLVLTIVAALVFLRHEITRATRVAVVAVLGVAAIIGIPLLLDVFTDAGSEAARSADYRGDLLSLVNNMLPLGITPSWQVLPNGETHFGNYQSIDSELILAGLRFGLVPLLILMACLLIGVVAVLRGKATPATVALVCQIPAFATVALITQYASLVWFLAGLAVAIHPVNRTPTLPIERSRPLALSPTRKEVACQR